MVHSLILTLVTDHNYTANEGYLNY